MHSTTAGYTRTTLPQPYTHTRAHTHTHTHTHPPHKQTHRLSQDPRLAAWWDGSTLVGAIDGFEPRHRDVERPLRLPVSESSKSRALKGDSVTGKVSAGAVMAGMQVMVQPGGQVRGPSPDFCPFYPSFPLSPSFPPFPLLPLLPLIPSFCPFYPVIPPSSDWSSSSHGCL